MNNKSILTKSQVKEYRTDYFDDRNQPRILVAKVRHDDRCGNGHNTFAITAELYDRPHNPGGEPWLRHTENGDKLFLGSCGCLHDEIAKHLPQLAQYIKWHLCSTDGPLHYIENTTYHASDRDYNRLRKGETKPLLRGGKPGAFCWYLAAIDEQGAEVPHGRLPSFVDAPEKPTTVYRCEWRQHVIKGEGKARDLDAARDCAVWPDATDEQLSAPRVELEAALTARLPALMIEFRAVVESLGFIY